MALLHFKGYHGTYLGAATSILETNFRLSKGDNEWLGDGVYFFSKGIGAAPKELAKNWAIAQAWNNSAKIYHYREYAALEAFINVQDEELLDLTTKEGTDLFRYVFETNKEAIQHMIHQKGLKCIDGVTLNFMSTRLGLPVKAVLGNFYFKFAFERKYRITSRIPNCTVLAIHDIAIIQQIAIVDPNNF